jgi:hypothetical protein
MEELQSTEILDREILEDARKKAARILKTADDSIAAKAAEWEAKAQANVDDLRAAHASALARAGSEIMARLPMDKRRAKAEKIECLLRQAVHGWYTALGSGGALALLQKELTARLAVCGDLFAAGARPRILARGLDRAGVEAALRGLLPALPPGNTDIIEEKAAAGGYPEIIIETPQVRVTASIQKTADYFLHKNRAQLLAALLGDDFSPDEDSVAGNGLAGGEAP